MRKPGMYLLCIAILLGLCSCGGTTATGTVPNPINTGATITLDVAQGIRLVEDGIRSANTAKAVDDATTTKVLQLCNRIDKAGKDVNAVLRSQATGAKVSVATLLTPIITAIQAGIDQDVVKISDQPTRDKIRFALVAVQATIQSVLAALGVS